MLAGAYLVSMDAKTKHQPQESGKNQSVSGENRKNSNFVVDFLRALWGFKAGLFMMGVSLCWYIIKFYPPTFIRTYTSALEKYILYGSGIPAPFFLGIQRAIMGIPCMFVSMSK